VSDRVLVTGATGGVGQLVVARLIEKRMPVRVITRGVERAQKMFEGKVEAIAADTRHPETLPPAMQDVGYIICCTGTTAFPSEKWDFDVSQTANPVEKFLEWSRIYFDGEYRRTKAKNGPEQVDAEGVRNLVSAAPEDLKRFVFISSAGVERKDQFPYSILNAFGVLDAKQKGETAITASGLPYTIIRPGRLIDGPYTSYDLNTLLKATTNGKQGIVLGTGDTLNGQTSRIDVAAACVECLNNPVTENMVIEIINQGPRPAAIDWLALFAQLPRNK
jgi:uncharacterized protein YbjT (DUF2867 family)